MIELLSWPLWQVLVLLGAIYALGRLLHWRAERTGEAQRTRDALRQVSRPWPGGDDE